MWCPAWKRWSPILLRPEAGFRYSSLPILSRGLSGSIGGRTHRGEQWWLILDGALSVLFGILLFIMPGAGAVALIWLIALFAIAFEILMIGFAFKVRKFKAA